MLAFNPNRAMKYVTLEGITASVIFAIMNPFLTLFAPAFGATPLPAPTGLP